MNGRAMVVAVGIDALIEEALADGFEIVQSGRVLRPPEQGLSFADRVEGFRISLLGACTPPTWRGPYENRLFDDEERWVHLRRPRRG